MEDIRPEEIREGNLKAILGLFFQLSRYKQQQKQLIGGVGPPGRSVPSSPAKYSNIPIPGHGSSPKRGLATAASKGGGGEPAGAQRGLLNFNKAAAQGVSQEEAMVGRMRPSAGNAGPPTGNQAAPEQNASRQSMLERLRIVKTSSSVGLQSSPAKPGLGKRTSSSSGFSSARSDRSESSISLSSDTNFPSPSALRRIQENQQSVQAGGGGVQPTDQPATRRLGIRNKFSRSPVAKEKSASPKRSPKLGRSAGVTEIKDYGPIDEGRTETKPNHYPPHAYSRYLTCNCNYNCDKIYNINFQPIYVATS